MASRFERPREADDRVGVCPERSRSLSGHARVLPGLLVPFGFKPVQRQQVGSSPGVVARDSIARAARACSSRRRLKESPS